MDRRDIAIATISWARNENEEHLLKTSLTYLSSLGVPIYITDGGSGESFIEVIRNLPNIHLLQPVKGLWAQAKNSLEAAHETGKPFVFYTEPDKAHFFSSSLSAFFDEIEATEKTGIYMASRSSKAFASFPSFQQMTETTINNCCAELIGKQYDYVYGPFLMNKNIIPSLHNLPQNIGWGWRPYAFNIGGRLGYEIKSFVGDFYCPKDQRLDDAAERIYRMKQLTQNIEGLTLSAAAPI